jgi:hypothetical protein
VSNELALMGADYQRMRRTWLFPLSVLGPLGVTLLGVILFLMRHDALLKPYLAGKQSGFYVATNELGMIQVFAIGLGAALLASMIVDLEHRSDTWKAMLALPVRRVPIYLAKFAWCALLLAISSGLMSLGYAALMVWQNLGPLPWDRLAVIGGLVWVSAMPLLAFQLLLSTAMKNQALPLTVGILAPVFGMGMSQIPAWMPWRLMTQALVFACGGVVPGGPGEALTWYGWQQIFAIAGAETLVLMLAGALLFARREIR